jgi:hypothetical protein
MAERSAVDAETGALVCPDRALKGRTYKCEECNQRVILRAGDIRVRHFAHYVPTTKCKYYDSPGESDEHKQAKNVLAKWISEKRLIEFGWSCQNQTKFGTCTVSDYKTQHRIDHLDGDEVVIEHRDPHGKFIADLAVINSGKLRYIIEIKHSHATTTLVRPEPWFEVSAGDVCEGVHYEEPVIYLSNIRINEARHCSTCNAMQLPWLDKLPRLIKKYGAEKKWAQDKPCMECGRNQYSPVFYLGFRQVCKLCLANETDKVHAKTMRLFWGDD